MSMVHSCHLLFDHSQFALIHGPNIPGSYATLFFRALNFTSITSHIHSWVMFLLWLCLFSGVISPLISHSILGTYWPREFTFSVWSFCLFILFMGFSRQEYWSAIPFSNGPCFVRTLHHDPSWVALQGMAHHSIEIDKAVVQMTTISTTVGRNPSEEME